MFLYFVIMRANLQERIFLYWGNVIPCASECQHDGTNCHCYYCYTSKDCTCTLHETVLLNYDQSPKENVFYASEVKTDLQEAFAPIVEELIMKRKVAPCMIKFCCAYNDCHFVYLFFKHLLKEKLYYPPGAMKISKYHLVDMYTPCTASSVKNIPNSLL